MEEYDFDTLKVSISDIDGGTVTYRFTGEVDENFSSVQLPKHEAQTIIFELADINNFNSCGIREWIFLVNDLSKIGQLVFRQCSVAMIDQINMVPESTGNATIESFFAPYYSETDGEVNKLIDKDAMQTVAKSGCAPKFTDSTGEELEFDALEESYFGFLHDYSKTQAS